MSTGTIVTIVIVVLLIAGFVGLFFLGRKAQTRQEENQKMLDAAAQQFTIHVIDKKKMKLTEAGFPAEVLESVPKRYRRSKCFVVKAKVGPRVMSLMCDESIYDIVPVKKEVKATISGIYLTGVKGIRGPLEAPKKKKGFMAKLRAKAENAAKK